MTVEELVNDEVFRKAVRMANFNRLFNVTERIFCHYKQHIVNSTSKLLSISKHTQNKITIYDYTNITQDEISRIVSAKNKIRFSSLRLRLVFKHILPNNFRK